MNIKDKFLIYYWSDQLYVEWYDWAITIYFNGNVEINVEGEYYGPSQYYRFIHLCDLVGFIELMKEWRKENIEKDIKNILIKMATESST